MGENHIFHVEKEGEGGDILISRGDKVEKEKGETRKGEREK